MLSLLKRLYAGIWLAILFAAHTGQVVHIYREDPQHFAAFSGDLVPDNGATSSMCERCIIDDFYFYPFLEQTPHPHVFYAEMLAIVPVGQTRCRIVETPRGISLRAPPAL